MLMNKNLRPYKVSVFFYNDDDVNYEKENLKKLNFKRSFSTFEKAKEVAYSLYYDVRDIVSKTQAQYATIEVSGPLRKIHYINVK